MEKLVYSSLLKFRRNGIKGYDSEIRTPSFTRDILDGLGSPDKGIETVVITGSKGKGTVSHMLSSILQKSGKKVGLFTNPHIVHYNERIRINGRSISDKDLFRISSDIEPLVDDIQKSVPLDTYIGPMGIFLAIAMKYFNEQNVDIVLIEAGVGGQYDESIVLENKWLVVSTVLREHVDRIGPNLEDIIENKLALIKDTTETVFVGKQNLESMTLINHYIKQKETKNLVYGKQFVSDDVRINEITTSFNLITKRSRYAGISLSLVGSFQADNAALAVGVAEEILGSDLVHLDVRDIFKYIVWPGKCEIIYSDPMVVVDGTIHRYSAIHVREWLSKWEFENCSVIISIPSDKDYKGVIEEISLIADRIITTLPDFSPKEYPDDIEEYALKFVNEVHKTEDLKTALEVANESGPDVILILGTQHIIGNAKKLWDM
jgi:dihydrofolate synthase/folylpolyglutamate synthase